LAATAVLLAILVLYVLKDKLHKKHDNLKKTY
jgi:hypothetical protein